MKRSESMEITVALAQMAIARDRVEENEETVRNMAKQAADHNVDLLVLPELWSTGYNLLRAGEFAAPLDEGSFALMAGLAQTHQMHVVGTLLEANSNLNEAPYNTAALYGPDGAREAFYRKVHLFPPLGEVEHLAPGEVFPTFDLPWGRTALAICYDLRFPEQWRRYTTAGAQLVMSPAEWPVSRIEHWRTLLRARAIENQFFVVGCNRTGEDVDGTFGGHSAVIDPMGRVLVEGTSEPELLMVRLDLDLVNETRRRLPFLNDRKPDLYG
jgi:predicted amidohydrolase